MTPHIAASGDANVLVLRDHLLPIVRDHGRLEDLEDKNSTLRIVVLDRPPWRLLHWTPFNALGAGQASSPGYRHAVENQRARPDLPYGLEVWHNQVQVLSLLWADSGAFEIIGFRRGDWEAAVLEL